MSLSRVLRQPGLADAHAVLGPDPAAVDPVVRESVEQASEAAFSRGYEAGVAEGRRAALADSEDLAARLTSGAREAATTLQAARAEHAGAVLDLALEIARAVLGREPHDGGATLLERLRTVLTELDDAPLTVTVHPDDADAVARAVRDASELAVEADAGLRPGEARVRGPWSRAELTIDAALAAVREVLGDAG